MSESPFIPRGYQNPVVPPAATPKSLDKVGKTILRFQQWVVVALLFLIPIFFVPGLPASLGFDKVLLGVILGLTIAVFAGLSALRHESTKTVLPWTLGAFWLFVLASFVSAALSGDVADAVTGSVFEPHTAGFFAVIALLMTIPLVLQGSKKMSLVACLSFAAGAVLLTVYTFARILFGAEVLPMNSFLAVTFSPIGSFNDLAIFSGLAIILSLIALLQLPLKKVQQWSIAFFILISLGIVAIVNFFSLWIIIGFFSLLLLVYVFAKDTLFTDKQEVRASISPALVAATLLVCVTSITFVVAGNYLGAKLTEVTGITYLEVRPSMGATIDVAKAVYANDVLFGTGPNKFVDAWRLYKDQAINESLFWNTNFSAGFGTVPTIFITTGLLGGILLLVFHILYIALGYRMLLRSTSNDSFWYFFGVTTFVAAAFLWLMSYLYVTGTALMLLAALFTGLSFVAYGALIPQSVKTVPLVSNRRRGFLLMILVIALIILSVLTVFMVLKQYVAQSAFTYAREQAQTPAEFQERTLAAFQQYQDDTFLIALAQTRLLELQSMLAVEEPTEQEQQRFIEIARQAVLEAEEAIRLDDSNPISHATLADIFGVLAIAGFEDAPDRVTAKLEDAKWRDPFNPMYLMAEASLAVRLDDKQKAREKIAQALELKRNYSDALFLLTQIDVQDGKIDDAIATAQQIITLEPDNPTRYYQLGVLQAAKRDFDRAIEAYEVAIELDTNFANARYMLSMAYLETGRTQDALSQLRIVRESNQDNQQLNEFITQIETNGYTPQTQTGLEGPVNEVAPGQEGDAITSPTDPNTNLVSPVNTVPETQTQESTTNQPAQ